MKEVKTPPLKIALYGTGAMARLVTRELVRRGHTIVAALDPAHVGKSLSQLFEVPQLKAIKVTGRLEEMVACSPNVVFHSTPRDSDLRGQILELLKCSCRVVSLSGIAYLWRHQPALAEELDAAARKAGVPVVGTGNNPGFMMDLIPIFFAGVCTQVRSIEVRRVVNLSPYGLAVAEIFGLGLNPQEFEAQVKSGQLRLHVEIFQSLDMIADALGWRIGWAEETKEPIIATQDCAGTYISVKKGQIRGFRHTAACGKGKKRLVCLELIGLVQPGIDPEDVEVASTIKLEADPEVRVKVDGGISDHPELTTVARVVNLLPWVASEAPAGLRRLTEIPLAAPVREVG